MVLSGLFSLRAEPTVDCQISDPRYVGFIWHYPFVNVGSDMLGEAGVNAMMARCNWGTVQPNEFSFNFYSVKQQIQVAEKEGFKLVLLLEFNPFCSPQWLKQKCFAAGEGTSQFDGSPGTMPRIGSPIYRAAQENMVRSLVTFLESNDPLKTVTHYMPGVEWWFPPSDQYSAADIAGFRQWLGNKYVAISKLNSNWGGHYTSFGEVPAPGVAINGLYTKERQGLARVGYSYPAGQHSPANQVAAANDWTSYWNDTAADYINSLGDMVKRMDPSRPTVSFLTLAWAHAAEWDYVNWSQVRLDSAAKLSNGLDILGMQLCFNSGDSLRITAGLDLARKYGKPMWDMDLLDFVKGVASGTDNHLRNTHTAIQHGASSIFYCCWNGAKDFNFYPDWPIADIHNMVNQARKALEIINDATLVVDGAIVNPIVCSAPGDPLFGRNDVRSFMGWYKILERIPTTIDVVTLREIEHDWAQINQYRWILIPDCPCLSNETINRLTEYAAKGGLLIRGGRFGIFNENGVPYDTFVTPGGGLLDYGVKYAGADLPRRVYAGDTPPQMIWREETSQYQTILANALQALKESGVPESLDESIAIDLHGKDVRSSLFKHKQYKLVYLVNMEPTPADHINLVLQDKMLRVTKVFTDLDDMGPLNTDQDESDQELPQFVTSCIVQIEPASGVIHSDLLK